MTPLLPVAPEILNMMLSYFQKVAVITTSLVGVMFIGRAVLLQISVSAPGAYAELIKDTAQYFVVILLFPKLFEFTNEAIGALAVKLYWEEPQQGMTVLDGVFGLLKEMNVIFHFFGTLAPYIVPYIAHSISTLLIAMLVAIGPIVILINTMMNFNGGVGTYVLSLISIMMWPVLWNLLGSLGNELEISFSLTGLMLVIFSIILGILQLFSPLIAYFLFGTLAPAKSMGSAASKVKSAVLISKGSYATAFPKQSVSRRTQKMVAVMRALAVERKRHSDSLAKPKGSHSDRT